MSGYSPTLSSLFYEIALTSLLEIFYNTENGIRFVIRVRQWQLDVALARTERITNQLEASLPNATRVLDTDVTQLQHDMSAILRLRKEDLKKAERRHNQTLLFCVLVVLAAILLSWVLKHRGKKLFELLDIE
ncbi:hypothetical protein FPHYL_4226 [Fusarium phyllophilum]|uniref:Uncharacterized protein n=1 Tax=Fusarium phyllophilum TaxID=47803 RepID=A0A8H5K391_9HYPO|nr:hypothetical protein FPHYL_4226 [Fusarium phyllophilum]